MRRLELVLGRVLMVVAFVVLVVLPLVTGETQGQAMKLLGAVLGSVGVFMHEKAREGD